MTTDHELRQAAERLLKGPRAYRDGAYSEQLDLQNVADGCLSLFDRLAAAERDLTFIRRVLRLINRMECDDILWHWEGDTLSFSVNCSDLFAWGCADSEDVTPDNIAELERAYADERAITGEKYVTFDAQSLFACRMAKMRPQGACYPSNRRMWPLVDACGPEREVGHGNPFTPEQGAERREKSEAARMAAERDAERWRHVRGHSTPTSQAWFYTPHASGQPSTMQDLYDTQVDAAIAKEREAKGGGE